MNNKPNEQLPRISIRGLNKHFNGNIVLEDVNLDIMPGKSTTVIGMSGTGKSVLIKCILGLIKADAGEILVDGENWLALSENEHLKRMRRVGMLFQGAALFDSLKVWENVAFALLRQDVSKPQARARAIEVLDWVGLHDIEDLMPAELSGGMAKRVGLARTICHKPDIVFFDEPTTGLDPIMSDVINNLILHLHEDPHTTILTITHDLKSAAMISDDIALLCFGRIHRKIPAHQLHSDQDPMLRQFVEGRAQGPINCNHWDKSIKEGQ